MRRAIRNDHAEGAAAREATGSTMRLPVEPPFGKPPQRDAFGSQGLAERLAVLIHGVRPRYAISISGEWGIGKVEVLGPNEIWLHPSVEAEERGWRAAYSNGRGERI